MRESAKRQLLQGMGSFVKGSTGHAQAATTVIRQQKMAARATMPALSEVFTEGARAEEALASRRAKTRATATAVSTPRYAKKTAQVKAQAVLASKISGQEAYVAQPVLSAAHKYRLARQNGDAPSIIPAIDGESVAAAAAAAGAAQEAAYSTSSSAGASMPMITLLLGAGVGAAYCTTAWDATEISQFLGLSTAATQGSVIEYEEFEVSKAIATSAMNKQPLWLQRAR